MEIFRSLNDKPYSVQARSSNFTLPRNKYPPNILGNKNKVLHFVRFH